MSELMIENIEKAMDEAAGRAVTVHPDGRCSIEKDDRDAELERLRSDLAEARAAQEKAETEQEEADQKLRDGGWVKWFDIEAENQTLRDRVAELEAETLRLNGIAAYARCKDDCTAIANGPECTCGLDSQLCAHFRAMESADMESG